MIKAPLGEIPSQYKNDVKKEKALIALPNVQHHVGPSPQSYVQDVGRDHASINNIDEQSEDVKRSLKALSESGIEIDDTGAAVPMFSVRTWGHSEEELQKMVDSLVAAGFDEEYSKGWVADIDSVYSLVMENQKALSYENDERYSWLKKNSDYSEILILITGG